MGRPETTSTDTTTGATRVAAALIAAVVLTGLVALVQRQRDAETDPWTQATEPLDLR